MNELKGWQQDISKKYGVEKVEIYKEELTNHSARFGFLFETVENDKMLTRDYIVNNEGKIAPIESEPWCVRSIDEDEEVKEEGNYLTLGEAIEASLNKQYPVILSVWGTVDKNKTYPYVGVYDSEAAARNLIGKEIEPGLEIIDVIKGYCIIGRDNYAIDETEDFYSNFDDANKDLSVIKNHFKAVAKQNFNEKSAIPYDEQIYLLNYWLRTNLKDFKPTYENIKEQLFIEFSITDPQVYTEVHKLMNDE
jgi:hypothetical protein